MGSNADPAYLWLGSSTGLMSTAWTGYAGITGSGFGRNVAGLSRPSDFSQLDPT